MGDQNNWTGKCDTSTTTVEELLLQRGYSVNVGGATITGDNPNGITLVLVEEDGLINAYRDMNRDAEADRGELGVLPPVAVYNPNTGNLTVNQESATVAQR